MHLLHKESNEKKMFSSQDASRLLKIKKKIRACESTSLNHAIVQNFLHLQINYDCSNHLNVLVQAALLLC